MRVRANRPATYRDIEALPDNVVGEIVDGELLVSPRPAGPHAKAATSLTVDLGAAFGKGRGGPGGWIILFEPELHLGEQVLVPDLAGWRRERMAEVPDAAHFTLTPDWICEVLSPGSARDDVVRKLPKYAIAGVAHAWVVDPHERILQILRRQQDGWFIVASHSEERTVRAEPFQAIELDLQALWMPASEPRLP